jgi:type VI secretion system protein ImpL
LLVLAGALLVWFFGPLLAVDDHRFWHGATARLLTISGLFLLWGLAMVWVGGRRATRLDPSEHQQRQQRQGQLSAERNQVRGRFKEAVQALKTAQRYAGRSERWRHEVPWYLLIGQSGSGKTALVAAQGYALHLIGSRRARRGTAYCDWYFADDAVLVETAGRYLAQPDPALDGAGWSTLLGLLRSRRRTPPLNGVVVTLAVETLAGSHQHDLEQQARQVHGRLQEIQQTLRMDVPVYLVLTYADRLPGFDEFFDEQQGDDAQDVLGAQLVASAAGADIAQVREAFEALLQRLADELIPRLHRERNAERRGRMLDFPRQAASLGERLSVFVESAFSSPLSAYQRSARRLPHPCADARTARSVCPGPVQSRDCRRGRAGRPGYAGTPAYPRRQAGLVLAAVLVIGSAAAVWGHSYGFNHQRLANLRALGEPPSPIPPVVDPTLALLTQLDRRLARRRCSLRRRKCAGWSGRGCIRASLASRC